MADRVPLLTIRTNDIRALKYELDFYDDKVDLSGIAALDGYKNLINSTSLNNLKKVSIKRDWNSFWRRYAIYLTYEDGKTKKVSGKVGLTLDDATKARKIIDQKLS